MKLAKASSIIFILFIALNTYSQTTPEQIFSKGLENFYGGKFNDAIKFFSEYIKSAPTDYKGFNYRGLCYQAMKNYPRSIEDFTKVISIAPRSSEGFINRGNSHFFSNSYPTALQDFNDAIRINSHDIESYFGKSRVYRQLRRFSEALKEVITAEGIDPKNPRVYLNMAWVHLQLKDTAKVFKDIETALYYDSNLVFTNYRRDLLFVLMENYKNSLVVASKRVDENPNSYMAYFTRGFIYFIMNNYVLAKEDLSKSISLVKDPDPKFISVINQIIRSIKRNSTK
ncbi:MAG: tetratricopeptide repeat protein [Bacteroidota bacterium]|nr:tetratricopeptide repeat protein [Bacteroidota bacterium]